MRPHLREFCEPILRTIDRCDVHKCPPMSTPIYDSADTTHMSTDINSLPIGHGCQGVVPNGLSSHSGMIVSLGIAIGVAPNHRKYATYLCRLSIHHMHMSTNMFECGPSASAAGGAASALLAYVYTHVCENEYAQVYTQVHTPCLHTCLYTCPYTGLGPR